MLSVATMAGSSLSMRRRSFRVAHDVPFHLLPVEDDERVGGGVAADVTALDVHPEDDRVQRSRARVHVPMLRSGGP